MGFYLRLAIAAICVAIVAAQPLAEGQEVPPAPKEDPVTPPAPQPEPECKKGDRKPDFENCKNFYECDKNGAWKADSCFWYRKFDAEKQKCVNWGAHCATKPAPAFT